MGQTAGIVVIGAGDHGPFDRSPNGTSNSQRIVVLEKGSAPVGHRTSDPDASTDLCSVDGKPHHMGELSLPA